ncbi:unnamed protein product [Brachionus calyciflorus]|uniref:DNA-directed DNA polymerase n=1 Tax=Brachionus calyciflorus TaxID=104777 RepID=A0A814JAY3_9BILA|nr:unnamed protein product [Brachionus calyciflorus]
MVIVRKQIIFFEINGCLYHGCQKCYKSDTFNPFKQESMETTYNRHLNRINCIINSINGELVEIWECEWDRLINEDVELKKLLNRQILKKNLSRGRNEKIRYKDFTSLYRAVQKYCRYPVGHPNIITENLELFWNYKIINNKLVFTLCQACAEENMSKCEHSVERRCFEGTWISLEIEDALDQGYEIVEIYEVWPWEKTALYNKETKSGGLFSDYVDMFLKGKQESDGFPDSAKTREEKELYIRNYFEREGILLDIDKIEYNKGLRSVMKVLLNSFWGRFGMNTNKTQYSLISHPDEWFEMISNDQYIIHDVDFSHSNFIQVFYSIDDDMHDGGIHKSKIGERVVYFDTDSIIYLSRDGEYEPEVGDYLGEFADEVKKKGADHIVEFISARPKNYAYKLDNDIVLNDRSKNIKVEQQKFTRDKGIPDIDEIVPSQNNLIILDDLMKECEENVSIQKLFTIDSHHKNISVFFITQNIFSRGKFTRTLNLNSHYLVLFNNPRDKLQISTLARQMFPGKSSFFIEAYDNASSKPHGYLMIDLKQTPENRNRIQTGITPDEQRIIYTPK